ncbi:AbrB/MazE/SpoVT family DNA-binding domain-containing protein [Nitrosomonas sp.]|uniref:antitoxin n=1 Tax=Nitrosomonas sp. TaxID=42353 RepID=UPI0025E03C1A|nr:AbrB/MazE/SpoVT family DNA-binding domain-containing protein [Nitrosomonas sp.]
MLAERYVKLFRSGKNQTIRIPREFELNAQEAIIRREGNRLIIEPVLKKSLLVVLAELAPIEENFPDVDTGLAPLDDIDL